MGKQNIGTSHNRSLPPSLYDGGSSEQGNEAVDILSAMDTGKQRRRRLQPGITWLLLICTGIAIGWLIYDETRPMVRVAAKTVPAEPPPEAQAKKASKAEVEPQEAIVADTAAIVVPDDAVPEVNLTGNELRPNTAHGNRPAGATLPETAVIAATPTAAEVIGSDPTPVTSPVAAAVAADGLRNKATSRQTEAGASKNGAKNPKRQQEGKQTAKKTSSPKAKPRDRGKVKEQESDTDVDLIAALLSHISRGAPVTPVSTAAVAGVAGPTAAPKVNRDIVIRAPGESTELLVRRCQAIGELEGQLCRARICTGLWGKDAACPQSQQPRD